MAMYKGIIQQIQYIALFYDDTIWRLWWLLRSGWFSQTVQAAPGFVVSAFVRNRLSSKRMDSWAAFFQKL